jgi:cytoskeletal protein CcmA (bactofilin family)
MAIFGKTEVPQAIPPAPERAPALAPSVSPSPATVIGAKAKFVGDISGDEDILIHGRCEGNIRVNRKVTVAPGGDLQGDVKARWVVIGGKLQGKVEADERAELLASCSVRGNVSAPKVIIAEGAQLQGNVAMSSTPPSPPLPGQPKLEGN